MPKIVSLKDNNSVIKYPITVSDAVVDLASGKKLSEIIDSLFDYLYFEAIESSTIGFTKATGLTIDLKYKIDNGSWQDYSLEINITAGLKVYFKGDNEKISDSSHSSNFSITGKVIVGGNIMSLLGFREVLTSNAFYFLFSSCVGIYLADKLKLPATANYCYLGMFYGCTSLTTPPQLPAITLNNHCYEGMFLGCTSLTTSPELPATTLVDNCYNAMFYGCTSLTTAPELPATTSAYRCYYNMFYNCTSLSKAPSKLPATTLTDGCYLYMFKGCTSLTTAPELLATTLAYNCCDSMFLGCTSLKTAPSLLPATTLTYACYLSMFRECTSLMTAPELPATTLSQLCYSSMFYGCSNLSYIKALFTTKPTTNYTAAWVYNVAASGVFIKNNNATWDVSGLLGVPTGWQVYSESEWELARGYQLNQKQNTLVSGSTIKTINNESILGSGNINASSVIFRLW